MNLCLYDFCILQVNKLFLNECIYVNMYVCEPGTMVLVLDEDVDGGSVGTRRSKRE